MVSSLVSNETFANNIQRVLDIFFSEQREINRE
jgi:hypothetical protein